MLKELFDRIWNAALDSTGVEEHNFDNRRFVSVSRGSLQEIKAPPFPALIFHTLEGLASYIGDDKDILFTSVESPEDGPDVLGPSLIIDNEAIVRLVSNSPGENGIRHIYATASIFTRDQFKFSAQLDLETFVVEVQSKFVDNEERARLLRLVGNLTSGNVTTASDDGVTQQVSVRAGVTLKGREAVENPFMLAPYRTFPEVTQPASPYILRIRDVQNSLPTAMLVEADGGAWRLAAVQNIKSWLNGSFKITAGITILA